MNQPIYFSVIEFKEINSFGYHRSSLLLNIPAKELSYQVFEWERKMLAITGCKIMDVYEQKLVYSHGIRLTEEQIQELLPYYNALDFEPFRGRKMSMQDEGSVGYRDEISMSFCGITDSYIPLLRLPMSYYYDEEHEWPSERLYRYLVHRFFVGNKKMRECGPCYGAFSLFC